MQWCTDDEDTEDDTEEELEDDTEEDTDTEPITEDIEDLEGDTEGQEEDAAFLRECLEQSRSCRIPITVLSGIQTTYKASP